MNQKILREVKKHAKLNEMKIYQNSWDTVKAVLREKFIALNVYIRKEGKPQINNLNSHFKNLELRWAN